MHFEVFMKSVIHQELSVTDTSQFCIFVRLKSIHNWDKLTPTSSIGKQIVPEADFDRARQSSSNESRFNHSGDDIRVWRHRGERLKFAFALQRHTAPTAGVMVWGVIAYSTRSPLVLIRGTMTVQRYVHNILQPHVLLFMQRLLGAIFIQDNAQPHTTKVSKDYPRIVPTLP
ncbi:transposable element Tcb2 transposase [Trichonephila clavipes]|nr:transposable element Tcb2 transposase [Trichonephila clavipes]